MQLLGSGGVKRVVTGPWVRREWRPVRIRDSSWGPPKPSLRPSVARSRRVIPIGAVLGRSVQFLGSGGVKRVVTGPHGSVVSGDPSGSVAPPRSPPNPSLRPYMARSRRVLRIDAVFGTIRAVCSEVVVSNGSSRDHGSVVSGARPDP